LRVIAEDQVLGQTPLSLRGRHALQISRQCREGKIKCVSIRAALAEDLTARAFAALKPFRSQAVALEALASKGARGA
jgi:hypothetical protein